MARSKVFSKALPKEKKGEVKDSLSQPDKQSLNAASVSEVVQAALPRSNRPVQVQRLVGDLGRIPDGATRQAVFRSFQSAYGNRVAGSIARSYQKNQAQEKPGSVAAGSIVQRVPYAQAYNVSGTKSLLNKSEGRASPVNAAEGHPRQHVGRWEKAERFAEEQGKTKSVYVNTEEQDKAISSALNSAAGQVELAKLDVNPGAASRVAIKDVATDTAEVKVVKAKKKTGAAAGEVKSWVYQSGTASKATVIVDSMGTNTNGDIHIQTAFPVFE